jgi:hypothetical protein
MFPPMNLTPTMMSKLLLYYLSLSTSTLTSSKEIKAMKVFSLSSVPVHTLASAPLFLLFGQSKGNPYLSSSHSLTYWLFDISIKMCSSFCYPKNKNKPIDSDNNALTCKSGLRPPLPSQLNFLE